MEEFGKPVIGYFEIPINDKTNLRLKVTHHYTLNSSYKAAFVFPVPYFNEPLQNAVIKPKDDVLMVCGTKKYTIPDDDVMGVNIRHVARITSKTHVAFLANRRKYFAICELLPNQPNDVAPYEINVEFPYGRNPTILDEIEKLSFDAMVIKPVKKADEVKPNDTNTVVKVEPVVTTHKVEFNITRAKCIGVPCWMIPTNVYVNLKIKINKEVANKSLRLITRGKLGTIAIASLVTYLDEPNTIQVKAGTNNFWIVDTNEDLIDFDIVDIKIE